MSTPPSPPSPSDPEPPSLTPEIIEEDEALAEAVDAFVAVDSAARERLVNVSLDVECIRAVLDGEAWLLFVEVEEAMNERWAGLATKIAVWAFNEGRRHPLLIEEGAS